MPTVSIFVEDHPETALAVMCDGCRDERIYSWAKIMRRMLELRLNPVTSGVHTLGELITAPCAKCKGISYSTKVWWPQRGPTVMSYAEAKKRV